MFLIYLNDMAQAVRSTLLLYVNDSSILYQHTEVDETETQLNNDFNNICDWFVNNQLSINFGKDKTKFILFASEQRSRNVCQLNIRYNHQNTKEHSQVTYLGFVLDETMSSEPMAIKIINKINRKLKLLYRKNRYLTKELSRMPCNALIQPHSLISSIKK